MLERPTVTGVTLGLVAGLALGYAFFRSPLSLTRGGGARGGGRQTLTFDGVPDDVRRRAVEGLKEQEVVTEESGEVYFDPDKAAANLEGKALQDEVGIDGTRTEAQPVDEDEE